jgi:hypothetical protein
MRFDITCIITHFSEFVNTFLRIFSNFYKKMIKKLFLAEKKPPPPAYLFIFVLLKPRGKIGEFSEGEAKFWDKKGIFPKAKRNVGIKKKSFRERSETLE